MRTDPWPMEAGPLRLRYASADDADRLLAFRNDPAVNRWTLATSVERHALLRAIEAMPGSETDFGCVAELAGEVVAMGFLDVVDGVGQPGRPRRTDAVIGYLVDPAFAGRGVATALARGLLAAAFGPLGLRRATAYCYAANRASARVLEKAGMRLEQRGVQDSWHAELGWLDGLGYGMLAEEWRARRPPAD